MCLPFALLPRRECPLGRCSDRRRSPAASAYRCACRFWSARTARLTTRPSGSPHRRPTNRRDTTNSRSRECTGNTADSTHGWQSGTTFRRSTGQARETARCTPASSTSTHWTPQNSASWPLVTRRLAFRSARHNATARCPPAGELADRLGRVSPSAG